MLMVYMAGTAVKLEDTSVLGLETSIALQAIQKVIEDLNALEQYRTLLNGDVYWLAELPVG